MADAPTSRPTLCIGVLTLNEERRIQQCLESAQFADQILVIDSGSTDTTCDIAARMGATILNYPEWEGFAVQRTRLLKHITTDYIFFLDADEIITNELRDEIEEIVQSGEQATWEVMWNQVAYGRALNLMKSTGGVERLFVTHLLERFDGVVHEGAVLRQTGIPTKKLKHRLLHFSRETVYDSLLKLAQYVQLGAAKRAEQGKKGGVLRGALSAFAIFVRMYIFRRGFLCGAEGFLFCYFIAQECFFRYAALKYDRQLLTRSAKR